MKQESDDKNKSDLNMNKIENNSIEPYLYQKSSVKITLIAVFAALSIGASYMLAPFINVEVMSVILFIAGFLYGKYVGIFVGLISSIIYYGWNPFGVPPLPLYVACVG
ncbi:MAG: ECF transporter S component, partial [Candidatus Helarchaeota archaeon]|nr:ECF transporter S component [Candidatus Helarchaeota archaeon]